LGVWSSNIKPNRRILIETPLTSKAGQINDILEKGIFLMNPPCKFADSTTILFADYFQIVYYKVSYFGYNEGL